MLTRQHYRPAYWRLGDTEGNYRRFFNIDGLVGVRVEDPEVFDRTHAFLLKLCADERMAGLRVDHIDGLWDPARYLSRLRDAVAALERPVVVLVEKILNRDEGLDARWPSTGRPATNSPTGRWASSSRRRAAGALCAGGRADQRDSHLRGAGSVGQA